ncbi:hypothetical protein GGF50DRAFT_115100 [Schizophyllum commune]
MAPPPSPLSSLTSLSDDDAPAAPQPDTPSAPESTHANSAASKHAYRDEENLSEAQKESRRQLVKDWRAEAAQPSTRCFGCEGAVRLSDVYESKRWFDNEKYCSHVALLEESGTVARSLSGGKGSLFGGDATESDDRHNSHSKARADAASARAGTNDSITEDSVTEETRRQSPRSRPRHNVRRRKNPAHAPQQSASAASTHASGHTDPDSRATAGTEVSATVCGGSDSETPNHNKGSNESNKRDLGSVDSLEKPASRKKVSVGRVHAAEGSTKDSSERGADRRDGKQVIPKDEDRIKGARPQQNHRGKVAHQHAPCRSKKARNPREGEAETAKTPVYRDVLVDALPAVSTYSDTLSAEFPKIAYSINGVDGWLHLAPLLTYAESSMRSTLQDAPTDGA